MCDTAPERQPRIDIYQLTLDDEQRARLEAKTREMLAEPHLDIGFEAINPDGTPVVGILGEMSPTGRIIFNAFMEGSVDPEAVILPADEPK